MKRHRQEDMSHLSVSLHLYHKNSSPISEDMRRNPRAPLVTSSFEYTPFFSPVTKIKSNTKK